MTEEGSGTSPQKPAKEWPLPSWKKVTEFVLSVISLERSVENLKSQNVKLQEEITRLQRQSDEQAGQLKVLLGFVQTSLREQVETSAERAAARLFERLVSLQVDPPERER